MRFLSLILIFILFGVACLTAAILPHIFNNILIASTLILFCTGIFFILLIELSRSGYYLPRVLVYYAKKFIETQWLTILHAIIGGLVLGQIATVSYYKQPWPYTNTIAIAALYIAGVQASLAVQHYRNSTKQQMRQATLEHARFAIDGFRKKERDLFLAMASFRGQDYKPDHALHTMLRQHMMHSSEFEKIYLDLQASIEQLGHKATTPTGTLLVPRIIGLYFANSLAGSSMIREMLLPYEMLAVGVMRKSFGFISVDAMIGPHLVHTYRRWATFIHYSRMIDGQSHFFNNYQFLVSCIIQYRANVSLGYNVYNQPIASTSISGNYSYDYWTRLATRPQYFPDINLNTYTRRPGSQLCILLDTLYGLDTTTGLPAYSSNPSISRFEYILKRHNRATAYINDFNPIVASEKRREWLICAAQCTPVDQK